MPVFGTQMFGSGAGDPDPIEVANSCRFDGDASGYMSRTPGSAGNRRTWTVSFWWKFINKASNENDMAILSAGSTKIFFTNSDNKFNVTDGTNYRKTSATFTDAALWHHFVVASDSTQGTAADRLKVYLDGSEITSWSTNNAPSQNFDYDINQTNAHYIGKEGSNYIYAYVSEFYLIDGSQKDAEDFGVDDDGTWKPIEYTGSYGTNGVYLDFEDSGNLGDDESGGGRDYAESGISSADQYIDTPTSQRGFLNPYTDTAVGHLSAASITKGNTKVTMTASSLSTRAPGTLKVSSGKWYWEAKYIGTAGGQGYGHIGIWDSGTALPTTTVGSGAAGANEWLFGDGGLKNHDNTSSTTGLGNWAANNIIQVCIDLDANKIWFGFQNTFEGNPAAGTGESFSSVGNNIVPVIYGYGGGSGQGNWEDINYGGKAFTYTPPSGFEAIASDNSQDKTVSAAPTPT